MASLVYSVVRSDLRGVSLACKTSSPPELNIALQVALEIFSDTERGRLHMIEMLLRAGATRTESILPRTVISRPWELVISADYPWQPGMEISVNVLAACWVYSISVRFGVLRSSFLYALGYFRGLPFCCLAMPCPNRTRSQGLAEAKASKEHDDLWLLRQLHGRCVKPSVPPAWLADPTLPVSAVFPLQPTPTAPFVPVLHVAPCHTTAQCPALAKLPPCCWNTAPTKPPPPMKLPEYGSLYPHQEDDISSSWLPPAPPPTVGPLRSLASGDKDPSCEWYHDAISEEGSSEAGFSTQSL
eukprot:30354_1